MPVDYPAFDGPVALAPLDMNRDGKLDLVALTSSSANLGFFSNRGDGTFTLRATYPAGPSPASLAAGDLNGDGIVDFAVASPYRNYVDVLFGDCQ